VFLVNLAIRAKLKATVFCAVEFAAADDGARTHRLRHAVGRREHVKPKIARVDHFDGDSCGNFLEGQLVVDTARALLDCSDVSLDLRDMLVPRDAVNIIAESCQLASEELELSVNHHAGDAKSACDVGLRHQLDGGH
jgi:hypothetical protein